MRPATGSTDMGRRSAGWTLGRAVVALSIGATVAVAATAFGSTFRVERIWLPLLVAAFGPVAVDALAVRTSRRQWWAAQLGGFVVGWTAAVLTLDRPAGISATARSLLEGWSGILSTTAPAAVTVATVTVPFLLTWWTAVWALALARRTARELTPVGPPVLLAVLAALFAPTGALPYAAWPLLFLAAAAAAAVSRLVWSPNRLEGTGLRSTGSSRPSGAVGATIAAALLGVAVLGGVLVGASGAGARNDAAVLRRWWQPDGVRVDAIDPFAVVSAAVDPDTAGQPLARLQVLRRTETGALRLRVSTADRFDGTGWSTGGRFLRTGDGVRPGSAPGPVAPLDVALDIDGSARLPFLPAPPLVDGVTSEVNGRLVADEADGMWAIAGTRDAAGAVPAGRYTLGGSELSDGAVPVARTRTEPPDRYSGRFADLARRWVGQGRPDQRARRLERVLRGTTKVDGFTPKVVADAASDPSLARVESLLGLGAREAPSGTPDPAVGSGTPAEFAAAFALLGRAAGLDTRLVLGVDLTQPTAGRTLQLRRGDLRIWPEVLLDRDGNQVWVPFDPAPQQVRDRVPEVPDPTPAGPSAASPTTTASTTVPVKGDGAADASTSGQRPIRPVGDQATPVYRRGIRWLLVAGLVVLVAAAAGLLLARQRRRARRTRGEPATRIAAGWAEIARLLARRKVPNARSLTPAQTEDAIIDTFGEPARKAAGTVHSLVDAGLFGPGDPSPGDAERMWTAVDELAGLRPVHGSAGARAEERA